MGQKKQVNEGFNNVYINIRSNLAKSIQQKQTDPMLYLKNINTKTII